jgi:hypothetical protein
VQGLLRGAQIWQHPTKRDEKGRLVEYKGGLEDVIVFDKILHFKVNATAYRDILGWLRRSKRGALEDNGFRVFERLSKEQRDAKQLLVAQFNTAKASGALDASTHIRWEGHKAFTRHRVGTLEEPRWSRWARYELAVEAAAEGPRA